MTAANVIAFTDEQRTRLLDACFAATKAYESLAASAKLFPLAPIGMGDINPKLAVVAYTKILEDNINQIISLIDDEATEIGDQVPIEGKNND
jgi:hypothetical protein